MSSHYFVKEGQEPALLILDPISHELVEPLLEWAPLVMIHEAAIDHVLTWEIKIDIVLTKQDNVESLTQKLLSQAPVKILSSDPSADLLENALYFLITTRQLAVTIVVKDARSFFDKLETFSRKLNICLLTPGLKWSNVPSGSFKKWLPAGSELWLHSHGAINQMTGLEGSNDHFKVLFDGMVEVKNKSCFWVGETL